MTTTTNLLKAAAATGDVVAYSSIMEELTGWTCRAAYSHLEGPGIAWIDPYGDQSGGLFESIEDLIGETYDELARQASEID